MFGVAADRSSFASLHVFVSCMPLLKELSLAFYGLRRWDDKGAVVG